LVEVRSQDELSGHFHHIKDGLHDQRPVRMNS
jgi:hypothetical protein